MKSYKTNKRKRQQKKNAVDILLRLIYPILILKSKWIKKYPYRIPFPKNYQSISFSKIRTLYKFLVHKIIIFIQLIYKKIISLLSIYTYKNILHTWCADIKNSFYDLRQDKKRWITTRIKKHRFFLSFFIIFLLLFYFFILRDLPTPTTLTKYEQTPLATQIYDRNGVLLYEIFAEQNRTLVSSKQIPLYLKQATIAIEDKDFYTHHGINPVGGILRAIKDSILKRQVQGGSTITQQLIKNTLLTPERTIQRKIKEAILAVWADFIYDKDEILTMYLNTVPYGGTAWGIDAAAKKYFDKKVEDLTLAESALLAGLPAAPTKYSPFGPNPELAITREHAVLDRMVEEGYISRQKAEEAKQEKLVFAPQTENIQAPHFVMFIKDKLVEKYGQKKVEQGGLKVTTSLDYDIQQKAEEIVKDEIEKLKNYNVSNAALVITRPPTGEILAMVGSVDYFKKGWGNVNVTTRLRQPGSSIKPINYAIGIENHIITASSVFNDAPVCFPNPGQKPYCPKNYDGLFHGPVQTRFALANSYNIPAVKTLKLNTVKTMIASSSAFGIDTFGKPSQYGLSLTLGGGEVRMTDMAEAFGVFANQGIRKDLVGILKVIDRDGTTLEQFKDLNFINDIKQPLGYPSTIFLYGTRVISPETAFIISHILLDNGARSAAFGPNSLLNIKNHQAVSVKTGTTDDLRDNWTIGYTPNFLTAVWVGNNDNTPMSRVASGITGATPIWNHVMEYVLKDQEDLWPTQPSGIVGKIVCSISGMQPNPDNPCPSTRYEYFIKGTEPPIEQLLHQPIPVWKDTDRPASFTDMQKNPDSIEMREHTIMYDVVKDIVCLDCPPPQPS